MDIDIIIPTKNSAKTISDCLKSLINQTTKCNIIVVDANSTDGTIDITKEYDVTLLTEPQTKLKGSSRARACNIGLIHSKSQFVGFVDSDVIVPPTWTEDLLRHFNSPFIVGVTSGCVWKKEDKDFSYACHIVSKIGSTHAQKFTEVKEIKSLPGYNSLYRRSAIDKVEGFDESIGGCEDRELNIRLRKYMWILLGVPDSPVEHRQNHTPLSFAKQMFGYAWSRGRLLKVKKIFTPLHMLPSLALILLIILSLVFPPLEFTFTKSLLQTSILHSLFEKVVECYLFLIALWSFVLISQDFTVKLWLQTILAFIIQHLSWAVGFIKGLID